MRLLISILTILFISFQSLRAQTPTDLKSWLPVLDGWTIADEVEVFNPDNLFDRINGAAPLYLENNFREMTSMEYKKGEEYITIQAYRHATPEDAFGMYASERSPDLTFYPIGGEAQGDNENFYFFAGNMYVKMFVTSPDNLSDQLHTIAKGLASKIYADASYPQVVAVFPAEGKEPHSEAYITSSYIGHSFLKGVYTANYKADGRPYQLFIIDAKTKEGAKETLDAYFTFTKQPLGFQEGELTVKDRYNGDIPIIWKGQYIIGSFSEDGSQPNSIIAFLKSISGKL